MFLRKAQTSVYSWNHLPRKKVPEQINERGPFSQPLRPEKESKGKNVDVSRDVSGTPRCDGASSSGYSDLPKRSEGRNVDVKAPPSSSSSGPTKSRSNLISRKRKDKVENVNVDDLPKHTSELPKLREKGNHQEASILGHFPWSDVPDFRKLKESVSFGTDLPIEERHGAVKKILEEMGRVNFVVAQTFERFDAIFTDREKCWHLIKEMSDLAIVLERLRESAEGMQDVMRDATSLISVCLTEIHPSASTSSTSRLEFEGALSNIRQELNAIHIKITTETALRGFTPIEHHGRSPFPKDYPIRAVIGQVERDLVLPELENMYINNGEDIPEEEDERLKVFKMEDLVAATDNFHKDNKVGEGGFGVVYKGTTDNGKQIAVKKMSSRSLQGMKEFLHEKLLAEVQQRNLVNLLGFCVQEFQRFLVYEYLPNGSLDKFLFDPENRKRLDWHKRYNIIDGIARGLRYLHEDSPVRIVHRDIKTSNILLDEKLKPKIADFGTAKVFPEDGTDVTATTIVGTFGYIAPEYFMTGKLSLRIDVYSFGIVVLELLTGEKISSDAPKHLERVWDSYKGNKVVETIDPTIIGTLDKEKAEALRCIQVGLLCIQQDSRRPTMSQVTAMLSNSESLPDPEKPSVSTSPTSLSFLTPLFPNRKFDVSNL